MGGGGYGPPPGAYGGGGGGGYGRGPPPPYGYGFKSGSPYCTSTWACATTWRYLLCDSCLRPCVASGFLTNAPHICCGLAIAWGAGMCCCLTVTTTFSLHGLWAKLSTQKAGYRNDADRMYVPPSTAGSLRAGRWGRGWGCPPRAPRTVPSSRGCPSLPAGRT